MTRKQALNAIEFAGYHNDNSAATRVLLNNVGKVSYAAWQEAYKRGQAKRMGGMRCGCPACKEAA